MFRDVVFGDVLRSNWRASISPFLGVLKEECELKKKIEQCGITDAKSLYDNLRKESPTSRQDRRTSIEVAILIEGTRKSDSCLPWCPHPRMIADALTNNDLGKSNGALEALLRSGRFCVWDESDGLARRKTDPSSKNRSRKASEKIRGDCQQLFSGIHGNLDLGVLCNHFTRDRHVESMLP